MAITQEQLDDITNGEATELNIGLTAVNNRLDSVPAPPEPQPPQELTPQKLNALFVAITSGGHDIRQNVRAAGGAKQLASDVGIEPVDARRWIEYIIELVAQHRANQE